ncbi:MAG TPA: rhomboid family intramembrane serine protease [Chitinophagaceae bacterium]|nr:rhomboid family intramembrane serine protease [Chitinophagaceae bacterium]
MSEFRPTSFNILPVIIKNLMIVNGLVYLAKITLQQQGSFWLTENLALFDVRSVYFRPHQIITHMFMHAGFGHLFFNMFVLWMFGSTLENLWGPKRFLIFYVVCGIGAALLHLGVMYIQNTQFVEQIQALNPFLDQQEIGELYAILNIPTVGASGAIYGCLAGFGYLFPNSLIYLYFLVPIRAKYLIGGLILIQLWMGTAGGAGRGGVAHWAHLGGALVGFLLVYYWNKTNRKRFY